MYTASRALYAIALNGDLPKVFLKTTRNGLPIAGIITSTAFGCLAYLTLSAGPGKVFNWFANVSSCPAPPHCHPRRPLTLASARPPCR